MAREGINKARVQTARLALMARGEHPSIDSVRIELGNTGSKTTIHRYLRELDASGPQACESTDISDELSALVSRLAQRLESQAQDKIDDAQARFNAAFLGKDAELKQSEKELAEVSSRLDRRTDQLKEQAASLLATRERLQTEQTQNARLSQAIEDLTARLDDNREHTRSLEEKNLHARISLEQLRKSADEQREQQQRRHEQQMQQLQTELRQMQQTHSVGQDTITLLTRENERLLAETRNAQRQLDRHNEQAEKAAASLDSAREQCRHAEQRCASLEERARIAQQDSTDAQQQLTDQRQQNRVLELILIKTEHALESMRAAQPEERDSQSNRSDPPSGHG